MISRELSRAPAAAAPAVAKDSARRGAGLFPIPARMWRRRRRHCGIPATPAAAASVSRS